MPGRLLRALRDEQRGCLRAGPGGRLRRNPNRQRHRAAEHLSRIRRRRRGRLGRVLQGRTKMMPMWEGPVCPDRRGTKAAPTLLQRAAIADSISVIVPSVANRASPIFGTTTKRFAPAANFLSNRIALWILSFGKFGG